MRKRKSKRNNSVSGKVKSKGVHKRSRHRDKKKNLRADEGVIVILSLTFSYATTALYLQEVAEQREMTSYFMP